MYEPNPTRVKVRESRKTRVFLLSLSLVSAARAEAAATEQSEFAEMKTLMKSTEVN